MGEKRTWRRFRAASEVQTVKRRLESGRGPAKMAIELGLSTGQLRTWPEGIAKVARSCVSSA
jgi:hypothetical protein